MRMTEQELEAYIRQYTELEKECMKSINKNAELI